MGTDNKADARPDLRSAARRSSAAALTFEHGGAPAYSQNEAGNFE